MAPVKRPRPWTSTWMAGTSLTCLGLELTRVGFSYGAIGSLLAAALRPEAVHSLVIIEPPAFGVARGHPAVEALVSRLSPVFARAESMTPEEYDRAFDGALGFNHVEGAVNPSNPRSAGLLAYHCSPHRLVCRPKQARRRPIAPQYVKGIDDVHGLPRGLQ